MLKIKTKRKSLRKRIAIGAQSFGFGPVSKACAIAKTLIEGCEEIEPIFIANSISKEFIIREGLWKEERDLTISENEIANLNYEDIGEVDAAVIVLDPKLASFFNNWVPTYFVDSLGFMWDDGFFNQFPDLRNMHTYFVQNVFGAYDKLVTKGVSNLFPVGAIVDTQLSIPLNIPDIIFHLGGLFNIFNEVPIRNYIEGIMLIIKQLASGRNTILLTSNKAINKFEILRKSHILINDLPHKQTLGLFANSNCIFTSPGLTTLLELLALKIPMIPLPPQNLSQALIISNIVKQYEHAPEVWKFLAKHYELKNDVSEKEGVSIVQTMNKQLLREIEFQENYIGYAEKTREDSYLIPSNIITDFDGVKSICSMIYRNLELSIL